MFLAGETGEDEKLTIEPGKSVSLSPRLDFPGGDQMGSEVVHLAGEYQLMLLLVFEAEGKKQFVTSGSDQFPLPAPRPGELEQGPRQDRDVRRR